MWLKFENMKIIKNQNSNSLAGVDISLIQLCILINEV